MHNVPDPDRTRLDPYPAAEQPPLPQEQVYPSEQVAQEPIVTEGVADADHRRRRTVNLICTVINAITVLFAIVLAVHIVLVLGSANQDNGFASLINSWSSAVSLGLRDLFTPDNEKMRTLLNDGLAAIAWLAIGAALTYLIRRFALPGPRRVVRYRRVAP